MPMVPAMVIMPVPIGVIIPRTVVVRPIIIARIIITRAVIIVWIVTRIVIAWAKGKSKGHTRFCWLRSEGRQTKSCESNRKELFHAVVPFVMLESKTCSLKLDGRNRSPLQLAFLRGALSGKGVGAVHRQAGPLRGHRPRPRRDLRARGSSLSQARP